MSSDWQMPLHACGTYTATACPCFALLVCVLHTSLLGQLHVHQVIAPHPLAPYSSPHRARGSSSTTLSWKLPHTWSLPTQPTHTRCDAPSARLLSNDIISLLCSSSACHLCTCPITYR